MFRLGHFLRESAYGTQKHLRCATHFNAARLRRLNLRVEFYKSTSNKNTRVDPLTSILAVLARSCQILTTSWQPWNPRLARFLIRSYYDNTLFQDRILSRWTKFQE